MGSLVCDGHVHVQALLVQPMLTGLRLAAVASSVALKLPGLTCRHASGRARSWTPSAPRSDSLSGNRRPEQQDISEDDLDMDEVESKLQALVR